MRVALIQLAYGDDESMPQRVTRAADLVRAQSGHDLVVLPELWAPTGFDYTRWADAAQPVDGPIAQEMAAAARDAGVTLHAGSIVERPRDGEVGSDGRGMWNTSLVFTPAGELTATYRKIHRFGFAEGEPAHIDAGEELVVVDLPAGEGDSLRAGLATCYDLRFPEMFRLLLDRGAEVFVAPAAWPLKRVEAWRLMVQARAAEDQCFVIGCNTAGTHAGFEMGGHSMVVAPTGEILAEAGEGEEVLSVEFDPGQVAKARSSFPVLADRRLG
ncbi:carbon-nitrogen family hydrolase [Actinomycetota bacterium]